MGGIALLIGWSQFSKRLRDWNLSLHRVLGKIYVCAVILSSTAGLFIAFFSSGGIASALGFGSLALLWLFTILKAYTSVLKKDIKQHESWMIRNYALAFAAVTLRIYLPFSQAAFHADFLTSYRIISWLCWVPNILIAQLITNHRSNLPGYTRQKRLKSLRDVMAAPVAAPGLTDVAATPVNAHATCDDAILGAYGTGACAV